MRSERCRTPQPSSAAIWADAPAHCTYAPIMLTKWRPHTASTWVASAQPASAPHQWAITGPRTTPRRGRTPARTLSACVECVTRVQVLMHSLTNGNARAGPPFSASGPSQGERIRSPEPGAPRRRLIPHANRETQNRRYTRAVHDVSCRIRYGAAYGTALEISVGSGGCIRCMIRTCV